MAATQSETYWVYRDRYPVKRFMDRNAKFKSLAFAQELSVNYPGAVVSCYLQRLYEMEVFVIEPKISEPVKEVRDA